MSVDNGSIESITQAAASARNRHPKVVRSVPTLPGGVEHRVGPPPPLALIVGDFDRGTVGASLERLGCAQSEVPGSGFLWGVQPFGTFRLIFVGPRDVSDEDGVHVIRELHALSPAAKVLLLCPAGEMTTELLVEAMRAGISDVLDPHDSIALSTSIAAILRVAVARADRVLAIGAHPDDVEIGCAGTLLDHRRRGDDVSVLTMSHGAVGGDQHERIHESEAAAISVGAQLMLADLPDTRLDPGVDTIRMIEAVIRAIDPTVVYVHSKHDHHQDHRAVHAAVVSASRQVPQVFAFQSPSATNDFAPTKFIAIDDVVVRKVEVLGLFDSQRERSYLEPEMVIAAARYWARNLAPRAKYAEPFEVVRSLTRSSRQKSPRPAVARPVEDTRSSAPVVDIRRRTGAVDS